MTSAIQPYRQPARAIEVKEKPKPLFGLIRAPNPVSHHCGQPGLFRRVFMMLTFRSVRSYSVYRCPTCKKVWQLYKAGSDIFLLTWNELSDYHNPEKEWVRRGGALETTLDGERE